MLLWRRVSASPSILAYARKEGLSGDFLPKQVKIPSVHRRSGLGRGDGRRNHAEVEKSTVSVCSFDSDFLGEGVVKRKGRRERRGKGKREGEEELKSFKKFFLG